MTGRLGRWWEVREGLGEEWILGSGLLGWVLGIGYRVVGRLGVGDGWGGVGWVLGSGL